MNPLQRFEVIETKRVSGPASYPSGGFSVTFDQIRSLKVALVRELGGGEYLPQVAAISGNSATIKVRNNIEQAVNEGETATYTIGGEIAAGTDISAVTFELVGIGD